ncbi:MAG: heavy-metal-associated domain-containing protein [Bdellovibrio sp.]|nr:heavy-metal-associated domain-containing protein [Methylotenera sp.]
MNKITDKTTYAVSGMTCGGCVARVKAALSQFSADVKVTLEPPQAVLSAPSVDISALNTALITAGNYQLSEISNAPIIANGVSEKNSWFTTYKPLILVFAYILLVTLAAEYSAGSFELHRFMPNFMAGFFLVFSFFKMLDLAGFANSYSMYDMLAKRFSAYGYIYPFIELGLGTSYLLGYTPMLINLLTLIVMAFSSIGVILAVMNKQKIKCACLGTGFNLPMTTVTIIEDLLMAGMAAWMLI